MKREREKAPFRVGPGGRGKRANRAAARPPTPQALINAIEGLRAGDCSALAKILAEWPELEGVPDVREALVWLREYHPVACVAFERARAAGSGRPADVQVMGAVWTVVRMLLSTGKSLKDSVRIVAEEVNSALHLVSEEDGRWFLRTQEQETVSDVGLFLLPFVRAALVDRVERYAAGDEEVSERWVRERYLACDKRQGLLAAAGFVLATTMITPAPPGARDAEFVASVRDHVEGRHVLAAEPLEQNVGLRRWPSMAALWAPKKEHDGNDDM